MAFSSVMIFFTSLASSALSTGNRIRQKLRQYDMYGQYCKYHKFQTSQDKILRLQLMLLLDPWNCDDAMMLAESVQERAIDV